MAGSNRDQVNEQVAAYGDVFQAPAALLKKEAKALSDAELVALLFGMGVEDSRVWLQQTGSLRGIVACSEMAQAVMEFSRRFLQERLQRGECFRDPAVAKDFLSAKLRDKTSEVFAVLFLDNHHRLIRYEELFQGTIDGASVYPREVVKAALKHNAAAVIFAHNHPSGVAEPSQSDERITRQLREALGLIDVRVLDHLVVGDRVVSFAERGLI